MIRKRSKKRAAEEREYNKIAKEILAEEHICPVTGQIARQIHHMKGRQGYADEWARENKISLLIDRRYMLPVSDEGHRKIELNPAWAKEMGYSLSRLAKVEVE